MSDMEFMRLNFVEPPAYARPQHLRFCQSLMNERDWTEMVKGMPESWWLLFLRIKEGENTFNGKQILRSDVNTIIEQLKKCPTKRKSHDYDRKHHNIAQDRKERAEMAIEATGRRSSAQELEDGMYRNPDNGTIYKLYHTVHGANVQVAKELIVIDPGERATPLSYREGLTNTPDEPWIRKPTVRFEYRGRKPLYSLTPEMRLTIEEAREFGALYGTCCICGRMLTNELSIHLGIGPVCGKREFGGDFEFMIEDARLVIDTKQEQLGAALLDAVNSGKLTLSEAVRLNHLEAKFKDLEG